MDGNPPGLTHITFHGGNMHTHDTTPEVWKPIPGHPMYEVSTHGRVRSWLPRNRNARAPTEGRLMNPTIKDNGYPVVGLRRDGRYHHRTVHSLVAETFIGPRPEGHDVCHADGVRTNNLLDNLRYDTRAGNVADAQRHGTHIKGETVGTSKLVEDQVRAIRQDSRSHTTIARDYGVSRMCVTRIKTRQTWKHL